MEQLAQPHIVRQRKRRAHRCSLKTSARVLCQPDYRIDSIYSVALSHTTIGTLDSIGHGHSIAGKILAAFGNPVSSCKHSGESSFQLS